MKNLHSKYLSVLSKAICLCLSLSAVFMMPVRATNATWTGTTDGTWATGANWGGAAPVTGQGLVFTSATGAGGTTLTDNLMTAGTFTVAGITFNSGSPGYTINAGTVGGNPSGFTLTTGITNSSTSLQTINDNFALSGTDTMKTTAGGGNLTLGGTISGTGAIATSGAGTVTLSGANTYTGNTAISSGVVVVANSQAFGAATNTVTLSGSGVLDVSSSTVGYNTVIAGGVTIDVDNATSGPGVTYTLGTLLIDHETLTFADGANNTGGGGLSFGATTFVSGAAQNNTLKIASGLTVTFASVNDAGTNENTTIENGGNLVVTGVFSDNNTASENTIIVEGGSTVTLNGVNTFTGKIAIGTTGATATTGTLVIGGSGQLGSGSYASAIVIGDGLLNYDSSAAQTLSGVISGAGSVTQSGTGTLTLSGADTYTGSTTISGGELVIGSAGKLGAGAYAGNISIASGSLFNYGSSAAQTLSGAISGAGAVSQTGSGTLTLSGANSYAGPTTISGGVLDFANESALYNGATGSWTASNIIVNSGGTVVFGVGASPQFTNSDVTTLLTNLDGSVTTGGLLGGSAIGFDTTNAGGSFTISNAIADTTGSGGGSIGLAKLGTGTLVLSGVNTYSGPTAISGGTLAISGSGQLGSGSYAGAIGISSGANFLYDSSAAQTLSGVISGAGSLTQSGGGTLTLANSDTYTGGTIISGSTLVLANSGGTGNLASTGTVTIGAGGNLQLGNSNAVFSTPTAFALDFTGNGEVSDGTGGAGSTITLSDAIDTNTGGAIQVNSGVTGTIGAGVTVVNGTGNKLFIDGGGTLDIAGQVNADVGTKVDTVALNNATVTILSGGSITTGFFVSEFDAGAPGTATLNIDAGGSLTVTGSSNMDGNSDNSTMTYNIAGTFMDPGIFQILGGGTGNSGTLNLESGGVFTAGFINTNSLSNGTSDFLFNGGTLKAFAASTTFMSGLTGAYVGGSNGSNGSTIDNNGNNITIGQALLSGTSAAGQAAGSTAPSGGVDGGLTFADSGAVTATTTLTGANTYNGGTQIIGGTVVSANATGLGATTGSLAINGGGVLDIDDISQTVGATTLGTGTTGGTIQSTGGTATLTTSGLTVNGTGTNTIASSAIVATGAGTTTLSSNSNLAVNGEVDGTMAIGSGATLSGTGTVTGATTLNGGTINLGSTGNIGSTLGVTGGDWSGQGSVAGAVTSSSGNFNIDSGANLTATGGVNVTGGTISSTDSTGVITGSLNYTSNTGSTFDGVIADGAVPSSLTLNSSGTTLVMTGTSTYSGGTTITAGTLALAGSGTSLGMLGSGNLAVSSGATLDLEGQTQTVGALTGAGTITNLNSDGEGAASALIIGNGIVSGTSTYSGVITEGINGANTTSLTKVGGGTQILTGNSEYSGGTTIEGGILEVNSEEALGNQDGTYFNGFTPTLTLGGGELLTSATTPLVENVALNAGTTNTLAAVSGTTATYSGVISDATSPGALTVGDSNGNNGTVVLAGANTYTGPTTIASGVLSITGSTISTGAVIINSGATLAGTGSTGQVSLSSGGAINLADGVIGKLTIGSLTTTGGGSLTFEIGGSTTGTDEIADTGSLSASGSTVIDVANLGGVGQTLANGTYTILAYTGTQQSLSDFTLSTTTLDGKTLTLVQSGDNIEVVVSSASGSTTSTTYTLTTTAGSTLLHSGATTTLTTTVTNTGTGTADSLNYSGLGATAANGSVSGATTSGGPLAQNGTGTTTQTYTATTAGSDAISATGSGTNATIGGSATGSSTGTTINVYSGAGVWNTNGGGTWGTISATPTNWTANGGTPGITAGFLNTDSASFGAVLTSGTGSVTLDGENPSLNAITFDDSAASYVIAQGNGTGSITLDGNGGNANVTDLAGSHTISAPIELATSANVDVASGQQLTMSGTISGVGGLVNNGLGTTVISGSNNYSGGTTVSSGTLELNNGNVGSATGSGALNVGAGAILAGIGSSHGSNFNITGSSSGPVATVLVGHNSATDLNTTGVMSLSATGSSSIGAANLVFNLNATVAGQGNQLSVGATAIAFNTLSSMSTTLTLNLQGSHIIASGTTYVLIAGTTASGGSGQLGSQYTGLDLGTSISLGNGITETKILNSDFGGTGSLSLSFGSANSFYGSNSFLFLYQNANTGVDDIEVDVVPEPGTWAMMLGGLALLLFWQRRKSKSNQP